MARQGWEETPEEATARVAREEEQRRERIDTGNSSITEHAPDYGGGQYGKPGDTSAYDEDVNRGQNMGQQSWDRSANQLDQTQANQSRGLQMGALGLMGGAARGQAPSRAASLGAAATDTTTRNALSNMAGARGPGAAVAGANQVGQAAGDQMAQNNAQAAQMRAAEMAHAQGAYAGAAQGTQGQDIGASTANANLQAQQNALNERRQEGFEGRAHDVRNLQGNIAARNEVLAGNQRNQSEALRREKEATDRSDKKNLFNTAISTVGSLASIFSDERTKENVRPLPMGSLAHLMRKK